MAERTFFDNVLAFLILASATFVMVILLVATRSQYDSFPTSGRFIAWVVVVGGVAILGSLTAMLIRLYVQPALTNGHLRRRKRNP